MLSEGFRRLDDLRRLALSEARYRSLVESTDFFVMLLEMDGSYTYISPQVEQWTGHAPAEFYAASFLIARSLSKY